MGPRVSPSARSRRRRVSSESGRGGTGHTGLSQTTVSSGLAVPVPGLCRSLGAWPRSSSSRCSSGQRVLQLAGESGTAEPPGSAAVLPDGPGARRWLELPWCHGDWCVPKGEGSRHPEPPSSTLGLGLLVTWEEPRVSSGERWGCPWSPGTSRTVGLELEELLAPLGGWLGALGRISVSSKEPVVSSPSPPDMSPPDMSPPHGVTQCPEVVAGSLGTPWGARSLGGLWGISSVSSKREEEEEEVLSFAAYAWRRLLVLGVTWRRLGDSRSRGATSPVARLAGLQRGPGVQGGGPPRQHPCSWTSSSPTSPTSEPAWQRGAAPEPPPKSSLCSRSAFGGLLGGSSRAPALAGAGALPSSCPPAPLGWGEQRC